MDPKVAESRQEILQICRLIQSVHEKDKLMIKRMIRRGVKDIINFSEPRDLQGVLHIAASNYDLDMVTFLLSNGAHPNIQDKKGRTPVMLAAQLGNDEIVNVLAEKNADMLLQDNDGKDVLFYCLYPTHRHSRCFQVALKYKADVNNVSKDGTSVFQLMCSKGLEWFAPSCLLMLDAGVDPNTKDKKTGVTVLMEAVKAGSLEVVRAILEKGGNPNTLDRKRQSAVHYAAMGGFFEIIKVLSAHSANMDIMDSDFCTPLHYAAASGNSDCCTFLAQRGCNPKVKNDEGMLAREIAKASGNTAAVKELRKAEKQKGKGSQTNPEPPLCSLWALTLHDWSHEHEAALREAFGEESDSVPVEQFVSVLSQVNAPVKLDQLQQITSAHDKKKEGLISISDFIKGDKYVKKPYLLSSYIPKKSKKKDKGKGSKKGKKEEGGGGKKGKKDGDGAKKGGKKKGKTSPPLPICTLPPEFKPRRPDGGPPLFMIEKCDNYPKWGFEKREKVYVNINDCVKERDLESLEKAFRKGVPVDVQDELYKTPLMAACSSGNDAVVQYLLDRGADVYQCDQFKWTPLHHAANMGEKEIIELLLEAGAAIDAKSTGGATPLMLAIGSYDASCVDLLIKAGASVQAQNKAGKNCLEIAQEIGELRIIDLVQRRFQTKGGQSSKSQPAKKKIVSAGGTVRPETLSTTAGQTPLPKDSSSSILQNTRKTAVPTKTMDITFVPNPVWGEPFTPSELLSKVERLKHPLSLDVDLGEFMVPFCNNIPKMTIHNTATRFRRRWEPATLMDI